MKAIASLATDSTTPVPMTLQPMTLPTPIASPARPRPTSSTLAFAPSDARSSTSTTPLALASIAVTVSMAPVTDSASGTATTEPATALPPTMDATGSADRLLSADASPWASAGPMPAAASARVRTRAGTSFFIMVSSGQVIGSGAVVAGGQQVGLMPVAQHLGQRECAGHQVEPGDAEEGLVGVIDFHAQQAPG